MQKVGKKQKIVLGICLAILILVAGFIFVYKKGLIFKAEIVSTIRPETQDRSADFGTSFHFPLPVSQLPEKFTFIIPWAGSLDYRFLQIRAEIEELAVPYDAYYFSPDNKPANAIPWETWQSLMANHSDWVLWSEPVFQFGTGYYLADPGADGYAEAWADAAIASAQAAQANWVFIDSINQTLSWTLSAGKRPADFKYPENDDTAWRAAITHFVNVVSGKARAAGLKVAVNTGTGLGKGFSGNIDAYVDAFMEERFAFGVISVYPDIIPRDYPASTIDTQITDSQSSNKRLLLVAQSNPNDSLYDQRVKFALAMYLIARKTGDVFVLSSPARTFWHPDFTAAQNLGRILSSPQKVNNVWMREYEKAIIVLNAMDSAQNMPAQAGSGSIPGRTGMIINRTTADTVPPTGSITKTTKSPTSKLPWLTSSPSTSTPTPTPETPDQPVSEETNDQTPSSGNSTTPNTGEVKNPTPSPESTTPAANPETATPSSTDPETENLTPSPKKSKSSGTSMVMGYRVIYYFFIPLIGLIILIIIFVLIKRKFGSRR
mgnify:FL=1